MKNERPIGYRRGLPVYDEASPDLGETWLPLVAEKLFAANVRLEREARKQTQHALARAMTRRGVKLSQSAIAKLERDDDVARRPIRLVEAAALAAIFDRTIDDMSTTPADPEARAISEAMWAESNAYQEVMDARRALADAEAKAEAARAAREALQGRD